MEFEQFLVIICPFLGTTLGALMVFFLKEKIEGKLQKVLIGFAAGVMLAASIWSLIIPSIEEGYYISKFAWFPAVTGFLLGMSFLLFLDSVIPHIHLNSKEVEGIEPKKKKISKETMFIFAITLHNIPEGMAVGVVLAGAMGGNEALSLTGAIALAIGIAIQNFPEGAIISMPLKSSGFSKKKAFAYGVLSGVVEPLAAIITLIFANKIYPFLPYVLSFAAGAMIYVIVEDLIPESQHGKHTNIATISFAIGFALMMILDIALG